MNGRWNKKWNVAFGTSEALWRMWLMSYSDPFRSFQEQEILERHKNTIAEGNGPPANWWQATLSFFFFFFVSTDVWTLGLCLLGKCSTTWVTSPALNVALEKCFLSLWPLVTLSSLQRWQSNNLIIRRQRYSLGHILFQGGGPTEDIWACCSSSSMCSLGLPIIQLGRGCGALV
jgi:hypothetical protein